MLGQPSQLLNIMDEFTKPFPNHDRGLESPVAYTARWRRGAESADGGPGRSHSFYNPVQGLPASASG